MAIRKDFEENLVATTRPERIEYLAMVLFAILMLLNILAATRPTPALPVCIEDVTPGLNEVQSE